MSRHETLNLRVHRIGFTRLSRSDSRQARLPKVNIIFLHGLRGHPRTTWEDRQVEADERTIEVPNSRHRFKAIFRPRYIVSNSRNGGKGGIENIGEPSVEHKVFWPRDYLLEDVPEAEVWTYGYNADVIRDLFRANNQNSVSQHGRDLAVKLEREIKNQAPIIFVAHSLGGVVVKDAIRRSELCQSRTKLVVFLGTPHRGSSYAGWGVIASNLASLAFHDANKKIVQALEVNSEVLDNIQDEFLRIAHRAGIKVHSFQEARAISGVKGLHGKVVDDYSSKVGLPPPLETVESIDANHMQMARCRHKTDPQYRDVVEVLKQCVRSGKPSSDSIQAQDSILATHMESETGSSVDAMGVRPNIRVGEQLGRMSQVSQNCYYIPLSRNRRFTGRDAILDKLKEKLFVRKEWQKLAVVGLGGVGKTQLVLQLAYWVKENQPGYSVFWVPAQSEESFEKAYKEIAKRLNIQTKGKEDLRESVRQYFESEKAQKWLLIVDNADDMEILFRSSDKPGRIGTYLPESDNGLTLFTTRSREVAVALAVNNVLDLHEMSPGEATGFLCKTLIDRKATQDNAITKELVRELTYLPLAIAQAAAYINQNKISIRKYLTLLQNKEQDQELVSLMSREFHDNTRYQGSQNAVATTWLVSFDQIRRSDTNAAELLSFISCIEPKAIPQSILPRPLIEEEMEHAIGVLCGYAFLVRRGDNDTFDMHRLVHIATRVWTQKQNTIQETQTRAIQHIASIFPYTGKEHRSKWREYLPHAQYALRASREYRGGERFELFYRVGRCLFEDRRFKEAIVALEETFRWQRQHFPETDRKRLNSEHTLASAYLNDGRIKEAIEIFEHVVPIQQKALAEKDPIRLTAEHELARAYLGDRRIKEAIKIFEHVVSVRQKTRVEKDRNRLASEQTLASAYLNDGRIKEAIKILEYVVMIRQKTDRQEDYNRLASEHELARAYLNNNQIKKAIEIFEHVVSIWQKTLLVEDHRRLGCENELATFYLKDGQIKKAIALLEHVVAIDERAGRGDKVRRITQYLLAEACKRLYYASYFPQPSRRLPEIYTDVSTPPHTTQLRGPTTHQVPQNVTTRRSNKTSR
ncbi:hypothetical protein F4859DRAFT_518693 [Xylaria cf. heliscus]|nr:hypothetical protein F4859DRAFT_518693 [Xylaria cf. heliscus]